MILHFLIILGHLIMAHILSSQATTANTMQAKVNRSDTTWSSILSRCIPSRCTTIPSLSHKKVRSITSQRVQVGRERITESAEAILVELTRVPVELGSAVLFFECLLQHLNATRLCSGAAIERLATSLCDTIDVG